jgi:uncharacterized membrane protein
MSTVLTRPVAEPAAAGTRKARRAFTPPIDAVLVGLVVVVALIIDLVQLGSVSLWHDEVFSLDLVRQPWPVLWHNLWGTDANMALYYLLLKGWLAGLTALGLQPTAFLTRLPSAVLASVAAAAVFGIGRTIWGRMVGLLAAALYVVNYLQLTQALQVRAYGLALALTCLSWFTLVGGLGDSKGRRGWWIGYTAASTLAVYAHLLTGLIFAAQLLCLGAALLGHGVWANRVRRWWSRVWVSVAAIGLLVVPILVDAGLHGASNTWVPTARLSELRSLYGLIGGQSRLYKAVLTVACLLAVLAVLAPRLTGAARLATRWLAAPRTRLGGDRWPVLTLLAWVLVPVAISYAASQPIHNFHLFFDRYLVLIVPPVCLLAAVGVLSIRLRPLRLLATAGIVVLAAPAIFTFYADEQREDLNTASAWIMQRYQAGDGVVGVKAPRFGPLSVDYILWVAGDPLPSDAPGTWSWATDTVRPVDAATLASYVPAHQRIFLVVEQLDSTPSARAEARRVQDWLDARYRRDAHVNTVGYYGSVGVWLYTGSAAGN